MYNGWEHTILSSIEDVKYVLRKLNNQCWVCRGQSRNFGDLAPSIDRGYNKSWSRMGQIVRELKSINYIKSNAQFFTDPREKFSKEDPIIALMLLQHYGVPTRLLDWSHSPWVATYFAVMNNDDEDGEVWAFNYHLYGEAGAEQWIKWPQNTSDGSGNRYKFDAKLTAFCLTEPQPWIICSEYPAGFLRQDAQHGLYTMAARFGIDHGLMLKELLKDLSQFHLYVIKAELKPNLRMMLEDEFKIYHGSLFPDSDGTAEIEKCNLFSKFCINSIN